jgi:hypothetical protein
LNGGGHDAPRVVAAPARFPAIDLLQRIGGGLARDGRLAFARALACGAVAGGAGGDPAAGVSGDPDGRGGGGGPRPRLVVRGQTGVPGRDGATAVLVQTPGDPRHDVVGTPAAGVVLHLLLQIALIEPGQARRRIPVALAIQPVAGEAGVARPAGAAAHGDHFA